MMEDKNIEEIYADASGSWYGIDWCCPFGGDDGQLIDADGFSADDIRGKIEELEAEVMAWNEALDYAEACEAAAAESEVMAAAAMRAYRDGDLTMAADYARSAAACERLYGDSPTWGELEDTIEAAVAEAE